MNTNFPFYCYVDGYHNDPTLYHFKSNKYTYDLIRNGYFPKACYAYLEIFDAEKIHFKPFLTSANSLLEAKNCTIDENCEVFVDIGANCGLASYFAYLRGAKKIFAFEPSPKESKAYLMNNIPNSVLYQFAISDSIGFKNLTSVWDLNNNQQDDKFEKRNSSLSYCVSLDYLFEQNLFERIDFLKIDVEGHEYDVFNGLSNENLKKIRNITVEIHGLEKKEDPKLGQLFQTNLKNRLISVPFLDKNNIERKRNVVELYKTTESHLYSEII